MSTVALVTDDDLARARVDPVFRQRLIAYNLEVLLVQLNKLHAREGADPESTRQIREGADLAVKLAEALQRDEIANVERACQN